MEKEYDDFVNSLDSVKCDDNDTNEGIDGDEFHDIKDSLNNFVTYFNSGDFDADRDTACIDHINSFVDRLSHSDINNLFSDEIITILAQAITQLKSDEEIYGLIFNILANITRYNYEINKFYTKDFFSELLQTNESSGYIKQCSERIYCNLIQSIHFYFAFPIEIHTDFWMKMVDIESKARAYAILNEKIHNFDKSDLSVLNPIKLEFMMRGINLYLNNYISIDAKYYLLNGIYRNLRTIRPNTNSKIITDIFIDGFMSLLYEDYVNSKLIGYCFMIFYELQNRNVYEEQLKSQCVDLITAAMDRGEDPEIYNACIIYYSQQIYRRRIPINETFVTRVADLIVNSPMTVRMAAINLVQLIAQIDPVVLSNVQGQVIEYIADTILASNRTESICAINALYSLHYSTNEIVAQYLVHEYPDFEEILELIDSYLNDESLPEEEDENERNRMTSEEISNLKRKRREREIVENFNFLLQQEMQA